MSKCDFNKVAKHRCFSVTFARFLRTPFLKEHLWWLFLYLKVGLTPSKNFSLFPSLKPCKNDEKCFLFHFKSSLRSQDI